MRAHAIGSLDALLGVAVLLAAAPAAAQNSKTYALSVSVHQDAPQLSPTDVANILSGASRLLKSNGCDVTFTLKGKVGTFSNTRAVIQTQDDRDAVYKVDADVKVVKDII